MENNLRQEVLDRLFKFKEQTGLTLNAFAGSIGMKHATLHNQFHGKRELSLETVLNTLATYPELSAKWLLQGSGEMVVSNDTSNAERQYQSRVDKLIETIQILSETIKNKNATIDALQAALSEYTQKSEKA